MPKTHVTWSLAYYLVMKNQIYTLCSDKYPLIYTTAHTKQQYTCCADGKSQTGVAIALECRQWMFSTLDVHGLDNQQIVVKTDDRIDQSNEYHDMGKG